MKPLKILYLEDSAQDAELAGYVLKSAGIIFQFRLVDTQDEYQEALKVYQPDIILADHSLFHFNSVEALKIFKNTGLKIPFILVTGTVSEEFAVNILKQGADDYLLKDNLVRLPNAVLNSLEKYSLDRERQVHLENIINSEALMKEAELLAEFGSWDLEISNGHMKWSDGIFHILGYRVGDVIASPDILLQHIDPEDWPIYERAIHPETPAEEIVSEISIIDKTGQSKVVYLKIVVQRNTEGQTLRLLGFMQDLTEKRKLEKELASQALQQQKIITEVTIQAQEKERNELGRELHDNINQVLATVKMFLSMGIENGIRREEMMGRSINNVNYAIEEIRKLSRSLVSPSLGDNGLIQALQELVDEANLNEELNIELHAGIPDEAKLDKKLELMLYRIAQEQLNNIRKYARATKVVADIRAVDDKLIFSISDDGIGFDPSQKAMGIGLKNIRSRVDFYSGNMRIVSAPGKGCTLTITIPF